MKRIGIILLCMIIITGCSGAIPSYDNVDVTVNGECVLSPVSDCFVEDVYASRPSLVEETIATYTSEDGLCVIEEKEDYYEVTLDYENGSYYDVGKAYGECIKITPAYSDYVTGIEEYIYENIHVTFPDVVEDYTPIWERTVEIMGNLPQNYYDEMNGLAEAISGGITGMERDNQLSYEEMILGQLVPDVLRCTACFGLSVWGDKTDTGNRYTARVMEWYVGSTRQIATIHSVVNMKNGEESYTMIGLLGCMTGLTIINNDGVMLAELDVGSGEPYECYGKRSYTYDLRYCAEKFISADECTEYLIAYADAGSYTYNPNVLITDYNNSYCVELISDPESGCPVVRDQYTELNAGVEWDNPDSLCVVNSYAVNGNEDLLTTNMDNYIRWERMNQWISEVDLVGLDTMKDLLTRDTLTVTEEEGDGDYNNNIVDIYSKILFHIAIFDYETGEIHVCFAGEESCDKPDFIMVGYFN